jgi:hypothetical protein
MDKKIKKIIGIAGNALVGKDTLCDSMLKILKANNIDCVRKSIAGDKVRADLKDFCVNNFQIDPESCSPFEKSLIRPLMVEYGRIQRKITNGRYFIDSFIDEESVVIVPDIRYCEYTNDELFWIKEEKKGYLIFLERDGILPANKYEEINNEKIKSESDFIFKCPTFNKEMIEECLKPHAFIILMKIFKNITISL